MIQAASKIPAGTYRIQFSSTFTFEQAAELVPYLKRLGISHLYASPCLKAVSGSPHGYNIVDYSQVNPELGGMPAFRALCRVLRNAGLALVLDIVPNHMAANSRNPFWWDVLMKGPASRHAAFFDIDWHRPDPKISGKVLVPVLGDHFHRCLSAGDIRLERRGADIVVRYFEQEFPLSPATTNEILESAARHAAGVLPGETTQKFFAESSPAVPVGEDGPRSRRDAKEALQRQDPGICESIDATVAAINADTQRLDHLLSRQHYCLAFWRTAASDINYRRFFDINDLIGICVENEAVFRKTHRLILQWVEQGRAAGLRIDHPDGLQDPQRYFRDLRQAAPAAWIVVEKILQPEERLPQDWPVSGTTGYDFLNMVGGLFVDAAGAKPMTELYSDLTGERTDFAEIVRLKKHQVLTESFESEIVQLTSRLVDIRARHRRYRDLTRGTLRRALAEVIAAFPVYRTYLRPEAGGVAPAEFQTIKNVVAKARSNCSGMDGEVWEFCKDLLLLRLKGRREADFVMRFQQFTGQVMAKGLEDTAFYCFNRLISLNEVGGDPARFGVSVEAFHRFCSYLQAHWPATMLTTASHDTKRGEDTRIRIHLLSEVPQRWSRAVRRWFRMHDRFRRDGLPDANTEYFLYQTLVGAWPIGEDRLIPYMVKAAREAKTHTSWTDPDDSYEEILKEFTAAILGDEDFRNSLERFLQPLMAPARVASLAQTLIRCTAPGVPDLYQGAELWDLNLVDPDNRRPVDFDARRRLLAQLDGLAIDQVRAREAEGLPKLFTIAKALSVRRSLRDAFGPDSSYEPLTAQGAKAGHAVAFIRGAKVLTLVPRLPIGLGAGWSDTTLDLPRGGWRNVLTDERWEGGRRRISELLAQFPVGLFVRER